MLNVSCQILDYSGHWSLSLILKAKIPTGAVVYDTELTLGITTQIYLWALCFILQSRESFITVSSHKGFNENFFEPSNCQLKTVKYIKSKH